MYPARHVQSVSSLEPAREKECAGQPRHVADELAAMVVE
jgi:hypothetical protein